MKTLPQLTTERLVLREVTLEDGFGLQAFQTCEEQWSSQAVEPEEFSDGTLRVRRYFEHRGPDNERCLFVYVAFDKETGELIGQISLSRSHPAIASIGFGVAHQKWCQGYGNEMAHRIIKFGFEYLDLNRITAEVAIENKGCIKLIEKVGMIREGVARECIWAQGRWWTEAQYAYLRSDFENMLSGRAA